MPERAYCCILIQSHLQHRDKICCHAFATAVVEGRRYPFVKNNVTRTAPKGIMCLQNILAFSFWRLVLEAFLSYSTVSYGRLLQTSISRTGCVGFMRQYTLCPILAPPPIILTVPFAPPAATSISEKYFLDGKRLSVQVPHHRSWRTLQIQRTPAAPGEQRLWLVGKYKSTNQAKLLQMLTISASCNLFSRQLLLLPLLL